MRWLNGSLCAWMLVAASAASGQSNRSSGAIIAEAERLVAAGLSSRAVETLGELDGPLPPRQQAVVSGILGTAYLSLGRLADARVSLDLALDATEVAEVPALRALVLNAVGTLEEAEANSAAALEAYQQSAAVAKRVTRPGLVSKARINSARVLFEAKRRVEAQQALTAGAVALTEQPPSLDKARSLLALGRLGTEFGMTEVAVEALREAEEISATFEDARLRSYALGYLGRLEVAAGKTGAAIDHLRQASFQAQAANAPESMYQWQWHIGRLLAAKGDVDGAIASYEQAINQLDRLRLEFSAVGRRIGYPTLREEVEPVYLEFTDLLLRRAAAQVGEARRQQDLQTARSAIEAFRTVELEDYFRDDCVAELQARVQVIDRLVGRTAAIYPIVLPERLVLLVSLPDGLGQVSVPVSARELEVDTRRFRRLLETRTGRGYQPLAESLYTKLIQPLEPRLERAGIDTLVVIPDGVLRTIPFAALHDGERFLVERYAIATAPGLHLLDPRPVAETDFRPLVNGLAIGVQGFPPLPYVEEEIRLVQQALGSSTVLTDQEFIIPQLKRTLENAPYSIIHIASHGEFAGDPDDSFILTYDGRLDMDELERIVKLSRFREEPIELLTLSACRTAAGDERAALGLAGIAVKAGARSVLASLWFVGDRASSLLAASFYENLAERPVPTKAEALQRAQLELIRDFRYRHPAYWAPFIMIGNWL